MKEKRQTKIGGQAVIEGVMMRGETSMALSVRSDDGMILTCSERIKQRTKVRKIPVVRGIVSFVSSLVTGMSTIIKSADMASEEEEKLSKGAYAFSVFAAVIIALGIFFFLPSLMGNFFYNNVISNVLVQNLVSGVLRIALFIAYLFLVSLLKDMKRTFRYHGAEHKTINCYESGLDLTVENIKKCSRRHNRCGTTFLFLVMLISILVFAFVDYGLKMLFDFEGYARMFAFMAIKLLFLPLVAGISYEVLFLLAKLKDNWFTKILRAPGLALQGLTTAEPDGQMIEVALTSFNEVLKMDSDLDIPTKEYNKIPISECYDYVYGVLDGLNAERVEADWMLCFVLNCRRGELKSKTHLSLNDFRALRELAQQRKTKPLDYCLGLSSFCGYDIKVDERVLIPRADTEVLASMAVELINALNMKRVLELCTGSGCVSLVAAKETNAEITASDISEKALEVAKMNLKGQNVKLLKSDLFSALKGEKFDLIIANPPYIALSEIESLQFEVRCQPRIALEGGVDGLDFYRRIAAECKEYMNDNGILLLEVGINQADSVRDILLNSGLKDIEITKDLSGIERVVKATVV